MDDFMAEEYFLTQDFNKLPKKLVPSLQNSCCKVILFDAQFTRACINKLPSKISRILLINAIRYKKDRCFEVILQYWPYKNLLLNEFFENISWKDFSSDYAFKDGLRNLVGVISFYFVKLLCQRRLHHLTTLDISGFPFGVRSLKSLKECIESHQATTGYGKRTKYADWFILKLNYESEDAKDLEDLLWFERNTKLVPLKIEICIIVFRNCWARRIESASCWKSLLNLKGVDIGFNDLQFKGIITVLKEIDSNCFRNISWLDIRANRLDMTSNMSFDEWPSINCISSLPNLKHLAVGSNNLSRNLGRLLSSLRPLTSLKINGCNLKLCDLKYLSTSKHMDTLQHLDLSENNLKDESRFNVFLDMVSVMKNSLQSICLQSVGWLDVHIYKFACRIQEAFNLKSINLSYNMDSHLILSEIYRIANLRMITLSKPFIENFDLEEIFHNFRLQLNFAPAEICWILDYDNECQ